VTPDASVPHYLQPAFLNGTGSGSLYVGFPSDITERTRNIFGLSAVLPANLGTTGVTFSDCAATITDLGTQFGAPGIGWMERCESTGGGGS
jgi:hypothetical protein